MRERSQSSDRYHSDRRRSKKKKKSSRKERSSRRHSRTRSRSRSSSPRRSSSKSRHRSPRHSRRSKSPRRSQHSSRDVSRSRSKSPRYSKRSRDSRSPPRRSHHSSSKDSSRSVSRERLLSKSRIVEKPIILTPEQQLKQKVEKALKAAANADAQIRGIGVPDSAAENVTSISDQLTRVNAIDEINASGFQQQTFLSSRGAPKQQTDDELGVHDSAIFGSKPIVSTDIGNKSSSAVLMLDENNLAHEKLCLNLDKKKERWNKKLMEMRRSLII